MHPFKPTTCRPRRNSVVSTCPQVHPHRGLEWVQGTPPDQQPLEEQSQCHLLSPPHLRFWSLSPPRTLHFSAPLYPEPISGSTTLKRLSTAPKDALAYSGQDRREGEVPAQNKSPRPPTEPNSGENCQGHRP